jgi:hypothetical protein
MVLVSAVLSSGCATTSTTTQVQRAPWVSFKGARTVAVELAVRCVDLDIGPELVKKVASRSDGKTESFLGTVSMTAELSSMVPVERESECDSEFAAAAADGMRRHLSAHLASQGYSVVDGGGAVDATLHGNILLKRSWSVTRWGERKDSKDDNRCQKLCGVPTCNSYLLKGYVVFEGQFTGPAIPGVKTNSMTRRDEESALWAEEEYGLTPGTRTEFACSDDAARKWFEPKYQRWDRGLQRTLGWVDAMGAHLLRPYKEKVELDLFKVDSKDGTAGIDAAKKKNWKTASERFNQAVDTWVAKHPKDTKVQAKLYYNLAVSQMELGDLEAARRSVDQSLGLSSTSEARELLKEIGARAEDRLKM